jgi:glycosyltransferase involved in cell wall biosynthesis
MNRPSVLHVIPSVSPKRGGPSAALPMLARAGIEAGYSVVVATTDDDGPGGRLAASFQRPVRESYGADCYYFPRQLAFYTVSWSLREWLKANIRRFDLVHVHALFSFPSVAAAHAAHRAGVPYVLRPLGVLNSWGIENRRRFLKRLSLRFVESPIIQKAAAIHYTSRAEQREAATLSAVIAAAPSAIIPLPVELTAADAPSSPEPFYCRCPGAAGREVVLFLSRIDPKKGIELLLQSFAQISEEFPNCVLVIAGKGTEEYEKSLQDKANDLGIASRVLWPGFLSGTDKAAAFASATIFVLPSYSENFGIAAAEALAAGVPVLLSDKVAVADDVQEEDAGLVVKCDARAITNALRQLLINPAMRYALAARGRNLAGERYSHAAVGRELNKLYESVLQEERSPA